MKQSFINVLNYLGIHIKFKLPKFIKKGLDKKLTIGKHTLLIDSANPIYEWFNKKKNYSSELGRLTKAVFLKYPNLNVIDIGSNVGDTLCIIKNSADVPVLCIEGDKYCFSYLEKNIKQFENVVAKNIFVGEETSQVQVNLDKAGWNTTIIPEVKSGNQKIKIFSLDDVLNTENSVNLYKLIKIDAEGFDLKILRGSKNILAETKPILYFEYNRDNLSKINELGLNIFGWLESFGYNNIMFYEASGRYFLSTTLSNKKLINDLHEAVDGFNSHIYYWDLIIFHGQDNDLASKFIESENEFRSFMTKESMV